MFEDSDSCSNVKLIVLALLAMSFERQGFVVGYQITVINVSSKETTTGMWKYQKCRTFENLI
jgi:hypothetical protein